MKQERIQIGHGSGGRMSRELILNIFARHFSNAKLNALSDSSYFTPDKSQLAYTTDSYVIDPIFFPGGNIGNLAVSGTVNDLAVAGAIPKFLSAGFILEEGFPLEDLEQIASAMAREAKLADVEIITGDTKVVRKGQCDKIFINTSGIGEVPVAHKHLAQEPKLQAGDKIIVSGHLGDHAIAILTAREALQLDTPLNSDVSPLNKLTLSALQQPEQVLQMRDITRGGLATILVEMCEKRNFGVFIDEKLLPVKQAVQSVCELFGFDPLFLANEGKLLMVVQNGSEHEVLKRLRANMSGKHAVIIGEITKNHPGQAVMHSSIGGKRLLDMLNGEMLPRIC